MWTMIVSTLTWLSSLSWTTWKWIGIVVACLWVIGYFAGGKDSIAQQHWEAHTATPINIQRIAQSIAVAVIAAWFIGKIINAVAIGIMVS